MSSGGVSLISRDELLDLVEMSKKFTTLLSLELYMTKLLNQLIAEAFDAIGMEELLEESMRWISPESRRDTAKVGDDGDG